MDGMLEQKEDSNCSVWPPLENRGVPQPSLSTKDGIIIVFMLLLWAYSIFLTARWSKTGLFIYIYYKFYVFINF